MLLLNKVASPISLKRIQSANLVVNFLTHSAQNAMKDGHVKPVTSAITQLIKLVSLANLKTPCALTAIVLVVSLV
jgi:hypothetical protein